MRRASLGCGGFVEVGEPDGGAPVIVEVLQMEKTKNGTVVSVRTVGKMDDMEVLKHEGKEERTQEDKREEALEYLPSSSEVGVGNRVRDTVVC